MKSPYAGQVSVNILKAGITKGEHWHHTKNEKFLVVSGQGVIRFRDYYSDHVVEYHVAHTYYINGESQYFHVQETIRESFFKGNWNFESKNPYTIFAAGGFNSPLKGFHYILQAVLFLKKEYSDENE